MALKAEALKREFEFSKNGKTVKLADPNPEMTPEQVMDFYAGTYPELTTSTVGAPVVKGTVSTYSFKTTVGTKG